jgi:hypothetical protein
MPSRRYRQSSLANWFSILTVLQRPAQFRGAALAHHPDVPVADEIGGDKLVDAGQIDNRIGSLLR